MSFARSEPLNTSVACVPDCAGKRCSSRSWAFWDSMPGTVKSSLNAPPTATAPPMQPTSPISTRSVAIRGRRAAAEAMSESREVMAGNHTHTQSKIQLNLEIDRVVIQMESLYSLRVAGLRERKKRATRIAIRDAAMRLFDDQGFAGTTMDQIAEAADVSRATVFTYFPTKEEIVFGDGAPAIEGLAARLQGDHEGTVAVVREWLTELAGWFEPELVLQHRLAREVPIVGARRLQLFGETERVIAVALEAELGHELAARLAAASLVAALRVAEETAAARMEQEDRALSEDEISALLANAVAFAEAGIAAIG